MTKDNELPGRVRSALATLVESVEHQPACPVRDGWRCRCDRELRVLDVLGGAVTRAIHDSIAEARRPGALFSEPFAAGVAALTTENPT